MLCFVESVIIVDLSPPFLPNLFLLVYSVSIAIKQFILNFFRLLFSSSGVMCVPFGSCGDEPEIVLPSYYKNTSVHCLFMLAHSALINVIYILIKY